MTHFLFFCQIMIMMGYDDALVLFVGGSALAALADIVGWDSALVAAMSSDSAADI